MPPPTYTEVSPRGWPLGFGERGFGEQRVLGWGPGMVLDAWNHLNGLLASSPGGSLRRQQQRAVSAERKSLSHFFFWTLPLPWDLAAAQAGVFLGALLQERPREGRPVPRQLPGRLRGVRGKGVEVSLSFVCSPRVPAASARTRNPPVWFGGCSGPCSQPKSSKKKKKGKKNQPQNQTKYQGAHVETGRSWRVRGAREVSVPQTPRSQIFSGRRGGCQPGRT